MIPPLVEFKQPRLGIRQTSGISPTLDNQSFGVLAKIQLPIQLADETLPFSSFSDLMIQTSRGHKDAGGEGGGVGSIQPSRELSFRAAFIKRPSSSSAPPSHPQTDNFDPQTDRPFDQVFLRQSALGAALALSAPPISTSKPAETSNTLPR